MASQLDDLYAAAEENKDAFHALAVGVALGVRPNWRYVTVETFCPLDQDGWWGIDQIDAGNTVIDLAERHHKGEYWIRLDMREPQEAVIFVHCRHY